LNIFFVEVMKSGEGRGGWPTPNCAFWGTPLPVIYVALVPSAATWDVWRWWGLIC